LRVLTIRERDRVPINAGHSGLSEAEAADLHRLEPFLPKGILAWEHEAVRFGSHCGIMRVGDLTLEILPKIFSSSKEQTRGVLVAMLRSTGVLADNPSTVSIATQARNLLDIFLLDFCERVNNLLRQGAIRTYQTREENLSCVRGRLNLPEHFRRNVLDRAHIHCRFDELTIDNDHNRLLRAVLTLLLPLAASPEAKGAVNSLLLRLDDVSRVVCSAADLARLQFTRASAPWRPIFEQANLFLRHRYPDIRVGVHTGPGLLFDMQRLFEAFVGVKLRGVWRSVPDHTVHLQGPQRHFAVGREGPAFRMIPDIAVVADGGSVRRLYDTKWKELDWHGGGWGIDRGDLYQMAAYAARYGCDRLALIYPCDKAVPYEPVDAFVLQCADAPQVSIYALDLVSIVHGKPLPKSLGPLGPAQDA
jgi:5-methylcytosine-specific restriction enzyme subunit McrC